LIYSGLGAGFFTLLCSVEERERNRVIGAKTRASHQGLEDKKQRRIRAWMCSQTKKVVGYTPGPELGSKAAACTTILSGQCLTEMYEFFLDGGFNTMTEPDFFSRFFVSLYFLAFIQRKNKKQAG
jgi:hypothetical protein